MTTTLNKLEKLQDRVKARPGKVHLVGLLYDSLPFEADTSLGMFDTIEEAQEEVSKHQKEYDSFLIYDELSKVANPTIEKAIVSTPMKEGKVNLSSLEAGDYIKKKIEILWKGEWKTLIL